MLVSLQFTDDQQGSLVNFIEEYGDKSPRYRRIARKASVKLIRVPNHNWLLNNRVGELAKQFARRVYILGIPHQFFCWQHVLPPQ